MKQQYNEKIKCTHISNAAERLFLKMSEVRAKKSPTREDVIYLREYLIAYLMVYEEICNHDNTPLIEDDALYEGQVLILNGYLQHQYKQLAKKEHRDYIYVLDTVLLAFSSEPFFHDFMERIHSQIDLAQLVDYFNLEFKGENDI